METATRAGPWVALVLGYLFGAHLRWGPTPRPVSSEGPYSGRPPLEGSGQPSLERDLAGIPPRELRRVPGIGDRRAVALARARWEHGSTEERFDPRVVHGVGPATTRALEAWLREAIPPEKAAADRVAAPGDL